MTNIAEKLRKVGKSGKRGEKLVNVGKMAQSWKKLEKVGKKWGKVTKSDEK